MSSSDKRALRRTFTTALVPMTWCMRQRGGEGRREGGRDVGREGCREGGREGESR